MSKLTAKQAAFVREYIKCRNVTQAAIKAGYSKKTASVIGTENLKKPNIAEAIKKIQCDADKRAKLTLDRSLEILADIAENSDDERARISAIAQAGKFCAWESEQKVGGEIILKVEYAD